MAMQTIKGSMVWPRNPTVTAAAPNLGGLTMSGANTSVCQIVQAPKTGNIKKIVWSCRTVTTGATVDVRLETVDTSNGNPSGTLWSANTNGSQVVALSDANQSPLLTSLTSAAAVVKGDFLAVVIKNPGVSAGNFQVTIFQDDNSPDFPYTGTASGGAYTFSTTSAPMLSFEYDDGTYSHILGACTNYGILGSAFNTGTPSDVLGARFKLPFSARVTGAWIWADMDGDAAVKLVDTTYVQGSSTGVLATITLDKDQRRTTNAGILWVEFPTNVVIAPNTYYRLVVEPTTTTTVTFYSYLHFPSVASFDAAFGDYHATSAKDPTGDSSWVNYNPNAGSYIINYSGLTFDQFDDGAASPICYCQ